MKYDSRRFECVDVNLHFKNGADACIFYRILYHSEIMGINLVAKGTGEFLQS